MALVKYLGPFDAVTLDSSYDADPLVKRGKTVELPDDLAASLVLQESWELVEPKAEPVKAHKAHIVKEA